MNLAVALCTGQGDTGGSAGGGGDAARSKKPRKERGEREKKQKKSRPEKPAKPAKAARERKRPVQPEPRLSRLGLCGAVFCLRGTVLMPQIIPIAAVRAIKRSLWATAGGKGPETRPKRRWQAEGEARQGKKA